MKQHIPFRAPDGVRGRQHAATQLAEGLAFLAPLGLLVAWGAKTYVAPDVPEAEVAAFTTAFGAWCMSRVRDWRATK